MVVDSSVDGKGNKERKTREVADIRMYHSDWNFLQLGCDTLKVIVVEIEFIYTFIQCNINVISMY